MRTPRQRLESMADAETRNSERIARYTEDRPGREVCSYPDYAYGQPDPDAYRRMEEIRDMLPLRHETYIRRRVTKRGKGPGMANPRKY